ncbi:ATP-binding cassette sub-family G member 5-like [Mizuhopecten yessoensis]|uniref:ATP-binding cassette sub-family G member 5 n=1 Tax=Mizuhopecten yessoensis TaxID=6573 RepID=A0A210QEQ7_MIZYE|nr:ATP-binding cassette sub-family G member 5-like [Mizuhopecten yessoensis]OWF47199.1 ATP-binding cassette sub-family G member 5 [Mizuhopecten yessoensis]
MTLNKFECTNDFVRQTTAYVIQTDRLLHTLTVKETLMYAALLRLPGKTTEKERKDKVNTVIQRMGLNPVRHSKIGGLIDRGISGGEKRRVTIAIQLLQDPSILLLDEPTTGLDSYTARHLVTSLAELAHRGTIVILSIHQPRSDIFGLLDRVALMCTGNMVYYGDTNKLVEHFTLAGYPCPQYANPLDNYVDVASVDRRTTDQEIATTQKINKLVQIYKNSLIFDEMRHEVLKLMKHSHKNERSMAVNRPSKPSVFRVILALLSRSYRHTGRDRSIYASRMFLLFCFVPFICLFLLQMGTDQRSIQDRIGLIYQGTSVPSYMGLMNGFYLFPPLRDLYYRESMDGLYSSVTFVIAYALYAVPFHVFSTVLFSIVVYWATSMYNDWVKYAIFNAVLTLLQFVYEMLTIGAMGFFLDPRLAINVTTLIMTFGYLVSSGLIRRLDNMLDVIQ